MNEGGGFYQHFRTLTLLVTLTVRMKTDRAIVLK